MKRDKKPVKESDIRRDIAASEADIEMLRKITQDRTLTDIAQLVYGDQHDHLRDLHKRARHLARVEAGKDHRQFEEYMDGERQAEKQELLARLWDVSWGHISIADFVGSLTKDDVESLEEEGVYLSVDVDASTPYTSFSERQYALFGGRPPKLGRLFSQYSWEA